MAGGGGRIDPEAVKDRLDMAELAARLGIEFDRRRSAPGRGDHWACCPLHDEATPSFHVDARKGLWHCFGCGRGGDAIALIQAVRGCDFRAALAEAAGIAGVAAPPAGAESPADDAEARVAERARRLEARMRAERDDRARREAAARRIWAGAWPEGDAVARYLAARGIDAGLIGGVPRSLREARLVHPHQHGRHTVMVAPFQDRDGRLTGVHRTFLAPGGAGKLAAEGAQAKMWAGVCHGRAIRLGPVRATIAIAEGIETALAWKCLEAVAGREVTVWAAGSQDNLCLGVDLPDAVREVVLLPDNDTRDAATAFRLRMAGEARLRAQGRAVHVALPPRGQDWLDVWRSASVEGVR